jgi:hypothetical protein
MPPNPAQVVPGVCRPAEVERAVAELGDLATRVAAATSAVETAERDLAEVERTDRERAAAALRSGQRTIAGEPAQVVKARERLSACRREADILRIAEVASQADLEEAVAQAAAAWTAALGGAEQDARQRAAELLGELRAAISALADAASAQAWLQAGGALDRPAPRMLVGSVAPSSRSRSVNSEPFQVEQLLAWIDEAVEPPPRPVRAVVEAPAAA